LSVFSSRNTHLWYSWLQAKRSALPGSADFISQTYADHAATLLSEDIGQDAVIDSIFRDKTFQQVLSHLRKQIRQILSGAKPYYEEFPSRNACFERTRASGGSAAEINQLVGILPDSVPLSDELISMSWSPCGGTTSGLRSNVTLERRSIVGRDEWESTLRSKRPGGATLDCTIQAVLEPLKCRVISKGDSLPYYMAKPLQKALWGSLQTLPCFVLTGRPFEKEDLYPLRGGPDEEWFSVDYSAATDKLSWKYSRKILNNLIKGLSFDQCRLAHQVLGPHNLHYPDPNNPGVPPTCKGRMKSGQLMGSVLSFPILCLANLGVYLRVTQACQGHLSYEERLRRVIINGDDMLYCAPRFFWEKHIAVSGAVGLKMSVGKSYVHPVYANVNSVSCQMDLRRPNSVVTRIDFLNSGLFLGQHKVQGASDDSNHHDAKGSTGFIDIIPEILRGSLPGMEKSLLKAYMNLHKDEFFDESVFVCDRGRYQRSWLRSVSCRNLFLPREIGGLGIQKIPGMRYAVTRTQKMLASYLFQASYLRYCPVDYENGTQDRSRVVIETNLRPTDHSRPEYPLGFDLCEVEPEEPVIMVPWHTRQTSRVDLICDYKFGNFYRSEFPEEQLHLWMKLKLLFQNIRHGFSVRTVGGAMAA